MGQTWHFLHTHSDTKTVLKSKNHVIWVADINSNKELFIAQTHGQIEKSYWLEWGSNPRPSDFLFRSPLRSIRVFNLSMSVCDEHFLLEVINPLHTYSYREREHLWEQWYGFFIGEYVCEGCHVWSISFQVSMHFRSQPECSRWRGNPYMSNKLILFKVNTHTNIFIKG